MKLKQRSEGHRVKFVCKCGGTLRPIYSTKWNPDTGKTNSIFLAGKWCEQCGGIVEDKA